MMVITHIQGESSQREQTRPYNHEESEGIVEQFVLEPLVDKSDTYVNDSVAPSGKEITSKRRRAKRQRSKDFNKIAAQNEALYDAEMNKRMRNNKSDEDVNEMMDTLNGPRPVMTHDTSDVPEAEWSNETDANNCSFVRDPFTEDLESLLREGEPIIPTDCWACKVVNDNAVYAVFNTIWLEFMEALEDLMSSGTTINSMGMQLYRLFHRHVVYKIRDISNGQCEVTGAGENEEVWSAYAIMHHFLVHSVTPERLQWVLIKRYSGLLNIQFRSAVVKRNRDSGRVTNDPKGVEVINLLVENLKKVYTWDTKKMCYSSTNKKSGSSTLSSQSGIYSGNVRYATNSIRRVSGGRGKPW